MSKKVFEHPAAQAGEPTGPSYWRSLDERNKSPEFRTRAEREFLDGASAISAVERREFLMLMGASFGLAGLGLAGCREPRNHTLPYAKQPENTIPGVATYYASSFPGEFANQPILVETHQHRPTKIEGNPSHRANGGASSKFAQASVLDMYDPDRAMASSVADARAFVRGLATDAKADAGAGLAFLARPSTSPTRARLVAALKVAYPQARWVEYTPVAQNRADAVLGARALPDYAKARRVLSLDRDFLGAHDATVEDTRAYSSARRADTAAEAEKMTRLYVVESVFSLTGAAADHRLRASSSHISGLAILFAAEVLAQKGSADAAALKGKVSGINVDAKWVTECVADLVKAAKGEALIVAGDHLSADAHRAVFLANQALAAAVKYVAAPAPAALTISALVAQPAKTLVILGGNPVYDAPADVNFSAAIQAAKKVVRLGYHGPSFDETSAAVKAAAGTFLASSHYLESWSDGRTLDGAYVPVQPMIDPLFATITELDVSRPSPVPTRMRTRSSARPSTRSRRMLPTKPSPPGSPKVCSPAPPSPRPSPPWASPRSRPSPLRPSPSTRSKSVSSPASTPVTASRPTTAGSPRLRIPCPRPSGRTSSSSARSSPRSWPSSRTRCSSTRSARSTGTSTSSSTAA